MGADHKETAPEWMRNMNKNMHNKYKTTDVTLSVVTAIKPRIVGKRYRLENAGELRKSPGGAMSKGHCRTASLSWPWGFVELLATLGPEHALMYGAAPEPEVTLLSEKRWHRLRDKTGKYTRAQRHIVWPATQGLLMLDYDPEPGVAVLDREALWALLVEAMPALAGVGYVWWTSSSSHILNTKIGEDLTGLRGQRFWIAVNDARGIAGTGAELLDRLWLAGRGFIKLSKSGAMLERTLVDGAVWQPERLDFAGGAFCGRGLHQDRGRPVVIEGDVLDVSEFVEAA